MKYFALTLLITLFACQQQEESTKQSEATTTMKTSSLEQTLIDIGYRKLLVLHSEQLEKTIWKSGKNRAELEKIAYSSKSSLHGRFLAAEVLRYYSVAFDSAYYEPLIACYVYALEQTDMNGTRELHISANSWGLLYKTNDPGPLGKQLISFGKPAIPHLIKLLDKEGSVFYEGSQESMIGNALHYRIKDFAAFYLSKITQQPIRFYEATEERDKEIERFRKTVEKN